MQPQTLVLGALGNAGTAVTNSLLERGAAVRAADLDPQRVTERYGAAVEALRLNFADPASYADAFAGIKRMFLLRPPQITDIQRLMVPALEAAKAAGVEQIVFLSLIGIESNRRVPHWQVEEWLRGSGVGYTLLRCSFFMQNLSTVHRAEICDRDEIYIPVGSAKTSFLDVRDIGAVAALTLTTEGHLNQAYELTGAEALDYYQVAAMFTAELGRTITYKNPSAAAFFIRSLQSGASPMYAAITTWLYGNTRRGMAERVTGAVQRLLGRPPTAMRQFIADYRDCWLR